MASVKTPRKNEENWEKEFDDRAKHIDGILEVKFLYSIGGFFLLFIIIWLIVIIWFGITLTSVSEISQNNSDKTTTNPKNNLKNSVPLK